MRAGEREKENEKGGGGISSRVVDSRTQAEAEKTEATHGRKTANLAERSEQKKD